MPYTAGYTDYPIGTPRPDIVDQVTWAQSLLIQNYAADKYLVIDKEVKGGLHRVKYKSHLIHNTPNAVPFKGSYDGIFLSRRVKGMLVHVEYEDDDTPLNKYYSLRSYPGTSLSDWVEVGAGSPITINNPKTVPDLPSRDALVPAPNDFVNVTDARTPAEITANTPAYPASYIWSGTAWLRIYPYGQDPRAHAQNTDTQLKLANGTAYTADDIKYGVDNPFYHKRYNDSTSVQDAIDAFDSGSIDIDGQGKEAWTSHKIAQELIMRPPCVYDGSADNTLYLDQSGSWSVPLGGGGGGTSLQPGDILGGGGADPTYFQ